MNSYLGIIKRHLLKDKKNYAIVIFSLIVSIVIIGIICGVYFTEHNKIGRDIEKQYGKYDLYLNGLTKYEANVFKSHNNVLESSFIKFNGHVNNENKYQNNVKVNLVEGENNLFYKNFKLDLHEGTLPKENNECIVSYKALEILDEDANINDYLSGTYIDLNGDIKEYKIKVVGIIDRITPIKNENILVNENIDVGEYILIYNEDILNEDGFFRAYGKIDCEVREILRDFNYQYWNSNATNETRYARESVLNFKRNDISLIYLNTPFSLIVFSLVILLICMNSISMIYKLKERDLNNLYIIGANSRQINLILFLEILIIWFIATIISLFIGLIFILKLIWIIAIAAVVVLVINLIAYFVSVKMQANKLSQLNHHETSLLIEKRLAFLHHKNNESRNKISILSIAVSFFLIILFFNQMFIGLSGVKSYGSLGSDILFEKVSTVFDNDEINEIKKLNEIESIYLLDKRQGIIGFDIQKYVNQNNIFYSDVNFDTKGRSFYRITLKIVDDTTYNEYLKNARKTDTKGVIVDISSVIKTGSYDSIRTKEEQRINPGEVVDLALTSFDKSGMSVVKPNEIISLPIEGVVEYDILNNEVNKEFINIIMSESLAKEKLNFNSFNEMYIKLKNPEMDMDKVIDFIERKGDKATDVYNKSIDIKNEYINNGLTYIAMSFILVVLSVINTIVTLIFNILSRKKEFKLLSSVGMTIKQIKKMIAYENYYIIMDSVKLGLIISVGLTCTTQMSYIKTSFDLVICWLLALIISCLIIISITIFVITISLRKIKY